MSKKEEENLRKLNRILSCDMDCDSCQKTIRKCLHDTRFCVNILLKKSIIKLKDKGKSSSMIT